MTDHPGSSKERGGVVGWIISHPKTTVAFGVFLLFAGGVWLLDAAAERRLQRQLDAIRASGAPVTVEDLNAAMPQIPDDENMAIPILAAADEMTAIGIPGEKVPLLPVIGTAYPPPTTGQHLPEDQIAAMRWYLDAVSEPLADVHEALELEHGCIEVTWTTPAINVLSSRRLSDFRHICKVLSVEAAVAAGERDTDLAGRALLGMLHFDTVLDCQATLIAALVQMASGALAQDRIERTVNLCGLDEPVLRQLQMELHENETRPNLKKAMLVERVLFVDTLEWARASGGLIASTPGLTSLTSLWRFVPALPDLDEADGLAVFSAVVEAVDQPDAASILRARAAEAGSKTLAWYCVRSRVSFGCFSRGVELWVQMVGQNRAMQAGLACERYRLATGAWPETLDTLMPAYLEAVPVDPFDDQPIRYTHIDEGIKVWSIGEDMKDNGGDVGRLKSKTNVRPADCGWVFLNPELRGRIGESKEAPAEEPPE